MIVYDSTVSERYAHALFNVAKRQGTLESIQADAEALLLVNRKDSKLAVFLEGPQFPTEDKLALIKKLFGSKTDPAMLKLLELLIHKGRIEYARPIFTRFIELAEADQGLHPAEVTTAAELNEADRQRIQQALEKYTSSRLRLRYRVEPAVLGGVRFTMGDLMIDDTVKGKLDRLRYRLQKAIKI